MRLIEDRPHANPLRRALPEDHLDGGESRDAVGEQRPERVRDRVGVFRRLLDLGERRWRMLQQPRFAWWRLTLSRDDDVDVPWNLDCPAPIGEPIDVH